MLTAKDIMTPEVITVKEATTIEELAAILVKHRISGAPVVDSDGRLIGIVTENDLISRDKRLHIPTVVRLFDAFILLGGKDGLEKEIKKMAAGTVGDICVRDVVTATVNTTVEDIATIMSEKKLYLIPVVEGREIKGVVGKIDLIKGMAKEPAA